MKKHVLRIAFVILLIVAALIPITPSKQAAGTGDISTIPAAAIAAPTTTTTAAPTTTTTVAPRHTETTLHASRGTSSLHLTPGASAPTSNSQLARIGQCESHGSYTAQNRHSTASGKYQVLDSTWGGYGGYSRAMYAPPAVQEQQAQELYTRDGSSQWNASRSCWG